MQGCALFSPKKFSNYKEGEWRGKALIRDKKEAKSSLVNLEVKAIDGEKLRMDITSPMGTHVASVLMKGSSLEYLNVSEKIVYRMQATRESLRGLLRVPIEPAVLYNIFFDRAIESKNWSCVLDKDRFLKNCKDLKSGLLIEWISREGAKRVISFQHATALVQINLYSFEGKISDRDKTFELKAPSSFKIKKS
ncbi:MAG: hypothetical protein A2Z20_04370 [Bdellovibrionales bacterium RBG_16_40_8]|nr:MAG: hypothetical protein A2Z20_04370 [Bdellovibrionales bacterium RBG_16_40_8]